MNYVERLEEQTQLILALLREEFALRLEAELVRLFGTPGKPKEFRGLAYLMESSL